jgi:hypothetical protein
MGVKLTRDLVRRGFGKLLGVRLEQVDSLRVWRRRYGPHPSVNVQELLRSDLGPGRRHHALGLANVGDDRVERIGITDEAQANPAFRLVTVAGVASVRDEGRSTCDASHDRANGGRPSDGLLFRCRLWKICRQFFQETFTLLPELTCSSWVPCARKRFVFRQGGRLSQECLDFRVEVSGDGESIGVPVKSEEARHPVVRQMHAI